MRHRYSKYGVDTTDAGKVRRTRRTFFGEHTFDSLREAKYYDQLALEMEHGDVVTLWPQVSFILPGGVRYRCDFVVFRKDGTVEVVDCKGAKTESYLAKKRLFEDLYHPVVIKEV